MCVHSDTASAEGEIKVSKEGEGNRESCIRKEEGGKAWGGKHHEGRLPFVLSQKERKGDEQKDRNN